MYSPIITIFLFFVLKPNLSGGLVALELLTKGKCIKEDEVMLQFKFVHKLCGEMVQTVKFHHPDKSEAQVTRLRLRRTHKYLFHATGACEANKGVEAMKTNYSIKHFNA